MPSDQSRDDGRRRDDESTDETLEWLHDRLHAEDRTYKERLPAALIHGVGIWGPTSRQLVDQHVEMR